MGMVRIACGHVAGNHNEVPAPPTIEELSGVVNGINRIYSTSLAYKSDSIRVWINGELMRADLDNGWVELGSNQIELNEAPLVGTTLNAWYLPI